MIIIRITLIIFFLCSAVISHALTIIVKDIKELQEADKAARPGDIIILMNGAWKDVTFKLRSKGTRDKPIIFRAQSPGKVIISGHSQLKMGGQFIIVEGLYFSGGYAGDDAVISYRINKNELATDCRVTNCVINDFNNPKRMEENYWVAFYGKRNRLDHCSFRDKKNIGVLLAVVLDDENSRENFHSIDHNYFGRRPPLASNGGEIIRVGVSQHAQFNSNTRITNNLFEHCDGETEIVSIKSGNNIVEDNVFVESQGSVVLRHGDNNRVERNIFLGNDKAGTGGVRIINRGQQVMNNIFFKCRGTDFRSPMALMNGIPNSPAHRYVQVTNARIEKNTFYECSPVSFGEGSDTERTLPPDTVIFSGNTFSNTRDSIIYLSHDDITGIHFSGNIVNQSIKQVLVDGFEKVPSPQSILLKRSGLSLLPYIMKEEAKARRLSGASWFNKDATSRPEKSLVADCANAEEIYKQLQTNKPVSIRLTGTEYILEGPLIITKKVRFSGNKKQAVNFKTKNMLAVFLIGGNGELELSDLTIHGNDISARHFISSDSTGSSRHYNLTVRNCSISGLQKKNGCEDIFFAYPSMVADSISFRNNSFTDNSCNGLNLSGEQDDKGYYNAEKIFIGHNNFSRQQGVLLNIYRGGNDESTLGPNLVISHNRFTDCTTNTAVPLINLTGVQYTNTFSNIFINCNPDGLLIRYKDLVRARHVLEKNKIHNSGKIESNKFVKEK